MSSSLDVDLPRLHAAQRAAHAGLIGELRPAGPGRSASHWVGKLSSSPLATATAVSALALAEQHIDDDVHTDGETDRRCLSGVMVKNELSELLTQSLRWLADRQNDDGGWGDTDRSLSNIATTMLVQAAFHLTGVPATYNGMLERAQAYIDAQGGVAGLKRRYGKDKTFAAPILTNCALAGLVPWRKVPALPFELACLPQNWYHRLKLPVVSYAIPALVAIGQARHSHAPSLNPLARGVRSLSCKRSLEVVEAMQPDSGGFLEATPLTSFIVMSLASVGQADHPVVRRGVEFLLSSVRGDGSWPIDSNLATWNTSQALTAIQWQFNPDGDSAQPSAEAEAALEWLLACQHTERHPYTRAEPGGWAWTDLTGGVPDADDTSAALLALSAWQRLWPDAHRTRITSAAQAGVSWLLRLQNRDGGFPTFCRGWGKLPFDRSSSDITAHAVRALWAWRNELRVPLDVDVVIERAVEFLQTEQHEQGSWTPLWFGNQHHVREENLVYGTAKVLMMYDDLGRRDSAPALRAARWLVSVQHAGGGWGPAPGPRPSPAYGQSSGADQPLSSVEETSLAVEALLPMVAVDRQLAPGVLQGFDWIASAVETGSYIEPSPIGFYFAKLWYYERLYPKIYAVAALTKVCRPSAVHPAGVRSEEVTATACRS